MITEKEQNELKEIIGAHYADAVSEILMNKGVMNKFGFPYSNSLIHKVFIGNKDNRDVERAIWELAANKKAEAKELEKQKKLILK